MYGVDQCRCCGVPIKPYGPEARAEQEKAIRKPVMPEKEWRKLGFLTPPTQKQVWIIPAQGCCAACGLKQVHRVANPNRRGFIIIVSMVAGFALIVAIITFLRQ